MTDGEINGDPATVGFRLDRIQIRNQALDVRRETSVASRVQVGGQPRWHRPPPAAVWNLYDLDAEGRPYEVRYRLSLTFTQVDGTWLLLHDQNTLTT